MFTDEDKTYMIVQNIANASKIELFEKYGTYEIRDILLRNTYDELIMKWVS